MTMKISLMVYHISFVLYLLTTSHFFSHRNFTIGMECQSSWCWFSLWQWSSTKGMWAWKLG